VDAKVSKHVDERIGAEKVDTTPQQVANARLSYPQGLGCLGLLQAPGRDDFLEVDEEIGPNP